VDQQGGQTVRRRVLVGRQPGDGHRHQRQHAADQVPDEQFLERVEVVHVSRVVAAQTITSVTSSSHASVADAWDRVISGVCDSFSVHLHSKKTRSHPEMIGDMSRVTVNFDLSKIPIVHF